jgi:multidrug efflux system membrane fusion protein
MEKGWRLLAKLAGLATAVGAGLFLLNGQRAPAALSNQAVVAEKTAAGHGTERTISVTSVVAKLESVPTIRSGVGWIEPVASVKVRARIEGEVVERFVEDGQVVSVGDVLFRIDDTPLQAQIAREEAHLARDLALLSRVEGDLNRARDLNSRNVASQAQVDQLAAEVKAARANAAASAAAIHASRIRLAYTSVKAPISGRVGVVRTTKGDLIGTSDEANAVLLTVTQMKPLQVTFALPERDLDLVRSAMKNTPDLNQVRVFTSSSAKPAAVGRLTFFDSSVDTSSGTIQLKAIIPNEEETLWPGQYVRVELRLGESLQAVTVPVAAIHHLKDGPAVLVIDPDNSVQLRPVSTAEPRAGRVAVLSGLKVGDHVVMDGHSRVRPGTRVLVQRPTEELIQGVADLGPDRP